MAEGARDWHKVSNRLRLNPKYVELSIGAKLTYRTLLEVAKDSDNGGFFDSLAQMKAMLPGELARYVSELVSSELLDSLTSNKTKGLQIHDFEAWQKYADPAARDRQRKRRDRAQNGENVTDASRTPHVDKSVEKRTGHGRVTDKSRLRHGALRASARVDTDTDRDVERVTEKESLPIAREEASDDVPDDQVTKAVFGVKPDDLRFGVCVVLAARYKFTAITDEQWELLDFFVDNEYPFDHRKGYRKLALLLERLPRDAGDPIAAVRIEVERRIETRQKRTGENEATKVASERKRIESEQAEMDRIRAQPGAEETAAERRRAIAAFTDQLGSPPAARPRSSTEGRQSA